MTRLRLTDRSQTLMLGFWEVTRLPRPAWFDPRMGEKLAGSPLPLFVGPLCQGAFLLPAMAVRGPRRREEETEDGRPMHSPVDALRRSSGLARVHAFLGFSELMSANRAWTGSGRTATFPHEAGPELEIPSRGGAVNIRSRARNYASLKKNEFSSATCRVQACSQDAQSETLGYASVMQAWLPDFLPPAGCRPNCVPVGLSELLCSRSGLAHLQLPFPHAVWPSPRSTMPLSAAFHVMIGRELSSPC